MAQCYECKPGPGGSNHVDCVMRKPRSKKKCTCWCLVKSSKYSNVFASKKVRNNAR